MAGADIPDDLRRFILTSVPSVPYLEAILLLQREHGIAWTAPLLARRLYLPEPRAADLLARLHDKLVLPAVDMTLLRLTVALAAPLLLLFGLIWEEE
jgi:hypothetical protein